MLPLDGSLQLPVIHADDVADACLTAIERRASGVFNLSAEPPLRGSHIAKALGASPINFPSRLLRPLVDASWRARMQPVDPGWLDALFSMPLLNTERARTILDWRPQRTSQEVMGDLVQGLMRSP